MRTQARRRSPFIDSSIDHVLLQTIYQSLIDFANIPKLYLVDILLQDLLLGPTNLDGIY